MDNQDTQGGITQNAVPATSPGGEDEHDGLSQDEPFSQTEPFSQAESFSQAEPFSQADQELHASQAPAPPPAAEPEFCLYRNGSSALLPNGGKAITAGSHRSPSNIKGIPPPAADFNVGSDMRTVSGTHCQVQVEDASSATFKVVHLSKAHDFTTVVRHGSEVIGDLRQAGQSVSACLGDEIQLVLGVTMHIVRVGEGPAGRPGAMQTIVWSSPVPKVAATAQAAPAPEVGLGAAPEASPAASSAAGRGGKGKAMRAPGAKAKQDKARRARKKAAADALGAGAGEGTGDRAAAGAVHGAGAADSAGAGTGTGTGADAGATTGVGGAGAAAATGGGGGDGAGWASVAALPPRARVAVGRFRRAAAEAAADMESAVASGDGTAVLRAQRRAAARMKNLSADADHHDRQDAKKRMRKRAREETAEFIRSEQAKAKRHKGSYKSKAATMSGRAQRDGDWPRVVFFGSAGTGKGEQGKGGKGGKGKGAILSMLLVEPSLEAVLLIHNDGLVRTPRKQCPDCSMPVEPAACCQARPSLGREAPF